ncbi:MAG: hypothetical protein AAFV80_22550, partial [Bacteroidota bacterium]
MGVGVFLRPKRRDYDRQTIPKLSRYFSLLLCGPDANPNPELEQLQRILDINLEPLRTIPDNLEPDTQSLEVLLYFAEEERDTEKMTALKNQIKALRKQWEDTYDQINKGWIPILEFQTIIDRLLEKIKHFPDFH